MTRTNNLMPNGIPRYVRCYDNGGETFDRYTVVFSRAKGRNYLAMSANPFHPQGFGNHGEGVIDRPSYGHLGKKIPFTALPPDCKRAVLSDYRELWGL